VADLKNFPKMKKNFKMTIIIRKQMIRTVSRRPKMEIFCLNSKFMKPETTTAKNQSIHSMLVLSVFIFERKMYNVEFIYNAETI
jgi:hypothetical protein